MFSLLNNYYINLIEKPSILVKINTWFFIGTNIFKLKLLNIILLLQLKLQKQKNKSISIYFILNYSYIMYIIVLILFFNILFFLFI